MRRETLTSKLFIPLLLILAIVSIYFLFQKNPFIEESVALEIFAPSSISAGDEVEYQVVYKNRSKTLLREGELVFSFPPGARRIEPDENVSRPVSETVKIGDLPPGAEGRQSFKTLLFGQEGEGQHVEARFTYKPENINAVFDSRASHELTIDYVPIAIKFTVPSRIHIGEDVEFSLNYLSTSRTRFTDLRLILTVPAEFEVLGMSRDPQDRKEGSYMWDIGELTRDSSATIYIRGRFGGDPSVRRILAAQIGSYDAPTAEFRVYEREEEEVFLGVPDFLLEQEVGGAEKGTISPGALLSWTVSYKNSSANVLENVSMSMVLEGAALDYGSLILPSGRYNPANRSISWGSLDSEDLAFLVPNQGGTFTFSVRVRSDILPKTFDDKHMLVSSRLTAYVSGVTVQEVKSDFKLNSVLTFVQEGYYTDSSIPNSGPLPPRAGDATTYTVNWQLLNTTNDLENVKVRAALPPYVSWGGNVSPSGAPVTFDAATGEVVWNVGKLSRGTGTLMQVKRVLFQIIFTPISSQIGETPELMSDARAIGDDTFTKAILEVNSSSFDTTLPDDPAVSAGEGIVQP